MAGKKAKPVIVRADFAALLADVKQRIQSAQTRAMLAVNTELVRLYWDSYVKQSLTLTDWQQILLPTREDPKVAEYSVKQTA